MSLTYFTNRSNLVTCFSIGKVKTVDFSETIAASDLKVGKCIQLIEIIKPRYLSIEGHGHFLTTYFPGFDVLCFTRPRYQVSVYRTIGPLVLIKKGH